MKLAMIGLGKMGANMVRRLARDKHEILVYDVNLQCAHDLCAEVPGLRAANDLPALIQAMPGPRVIWLMVPHSFVDDSIGQLLDAGLDTGDLIVDGGNSNYKQSQHRAQALTERGIHFVDCGTSGGVWGLENGYSLMVGGSAEAIAMVRPALESLAPAPAIGWGHVGPAGAGHFVKMIHNGIEYGMMQALAEGFELMESKRVMEFDLHQIARIWQHGSVVRSWLLDLLTDALQDEQAVARFSDYVDDSGEGRWTIEESIENAVPAPVLSLALQMRFRSRQAPSYAGKLLNAMRAGFGGHSVRRTPDSEAKD